MITKNHRLLTIGSTVVQAFVRMLYLERSCQVQIDASPHRARTASAFRRYLQARAQQYEQSASLEAYEWDALLIRLSQFDPFYKN